MKQLRLLALAVAATAFCSAAAFACGNDKTTAAAASSGSAKAASSCCASKQGANATAASAKGACSAEMAAQCTPEMAAACAKMKASGAVAAGTCPMTGQSCSSHSKSRATAAAASSDCCASGAKSKSRTTAAMASNSACGSHARTTTAAMAAMAPGGCGGHAKTATMAAGSSCASHGSKAAMANHSCDACSDMSVNEDELAAAGARAQVVPLKNGVMYVYTADAPERVRAVQAAVSRGNERARALLAAGDKAKLCPGCKELRGAMASGKLQREVVNVETGALTLVTSNDKGLVNRIHDISGATLAARTTH